MKIKIKRLDKSAPLPQYHTSGSAAFDLTTKEDISIEPGKVEAARTGLVICTPPGYMLAVVSRSSLPVKKGLTLANGFGVIDQDYCGPEDEILVPLLNFTDQPVALQKGDRIAQAMFLRIEKAEWDEINELESQTNRGGIGSTGGYTK